MRIGTYEARFGHDSSRAYPAKNAPSEHVEMLEGSHKSDRD